MMAESGVAVRWILRWHASDRAKYHPEAEGPKEVLYCTKFQAEDLES